MRLRSGVALTVLLAAVPVLAAKANTPKSESHPPLSTTIGTAETRGAETPSAETPSAEMRGAETRDAETSHTDRSETGAADTVETGPAETEAAETEAAEIKQPASPREAVLFAVRDRLGAASSTTQAQKQTKQGALIAYYAKPDRDLLFVDENGLTARGKAVIAEIGKADDYGLKAADYVLPDLSGLNTASGDVTGRLAQAEIEISRAVLDYAHDARGGRLDPNSISKNLDPTLLLPKPLDVIESIAFRSDPAAYLRGFQPQHPQFERLAQKLKELRGGETAKAETPKVRIPSGRLLKLGVADPQVALLRTRLEIPHGDTPELYDETVLAAVRRFQVAHNTPADGVVGPGTRRLLNAPHLAHRGSHADIDKILLNMERWRWLPQDLGRFHIAVNIPEFTLRVMQDDEIFHATRVIVGKPRTQTPVFSDEMQTVVFGPYWNVPNSIKVGEIRPYVRRTGGFFGGGWNTSVFQRQGLRIKHGGREVDPRSVDWNRVDIRTLHLFQPPGPRNVLGQVKFMFPNKHAVYMHDTVQKHLFSKAVRAESHGCIRVQNPDKLAAIIMRKDRNWSEARTYSAFNTAYNQHNGLKQHIPVYMTYFTLWVNEDGSMKTFGDLYGHDRRMASALFGGRTYAAADTGTVTQAIPERRGQRQQVRSRDALERILFDF